jgi:ATP-dependent RNA helicase RhlE
VIVPTRELVAQVEEEVQKLSKYMTVKTVGIFGGANINTQMQEVMQGVDVLVATPGRLLDIVLKDTLLLKHIKKLIIDEVDETLALGFRYQLTTVLDLLPVKKQTLMFSATISPEVKFSYGLRNLNKGDALLSSIRDITSNFVYFTIHIEN